MSNDHPHDAAAIDPAASTIVGLSFEDAFRAREFQIAAMGMVSKHDLQLLDVVTIVKDETGKTHVAETIDPSPGRSAISGGMWAGLFGLLLGGPIGWAAGVAVGAVGGAVTAKVVDLGLPDDWVAWFRDAVQPGTHTVVLLFGDVDIAAATAELERFAGARLVYANVPPDVVARIRTAIGDPSTAPLTQDPADPAGAGTDGSSAGASTGQPEAPPAG
jgi:uncharacterized membrane protein